MKTLLHKIFPLSTRVAASTAAVLVGGSICIAAYFTSSSYTALFAIPGALVIYAPAYVYWREVFTKVLS